MAAAVGVPLALGFGMFVFVTLGDDYFAHGALAGMISALVAGAVIVLLGERGTVIYAPRVTTTFFLGVLLYSLVHSTALPMQSVPAAFTILVLFAIMLLAGLFQALFGLLKLGTLIKFAPHPVMAGFQNMAALLLFLIQLGNVLGYDRNVPFSHVFENLGEARPLSVVVAVVTFLAMWHAARITRRVPPLLVGLAVGIACYYAFVLVGFSAALGPTIGMPAASVVVPRPYADVVEPGVLAHLVLMAPTIAAGALALAIVAAIDAMLCAKLVSPPGAPRGDSNLLLIRLGLANAAAAAAGGITAGINIGATGVNRAYGGRSWVSVAVNAVAMLAVILLVLPFITHLPRSVLSAAIMVVALQHFDRWSLQGVAQLFRKDTKHKQALVLDLAVALLVSVLSITVNIVLAVFLGIAVAVVLFVLRMSRSNIRRLFRGNTVRSRRSRPPEDMRALETKGAAILAIELQGALFFGSTERLAQVIDTEAVRPISHLVLDLRRVTEIDSTAVRMLADVDTELAGRGIRFMLVLRPGDVADRLSELPGDRFPDIDRALERAEDDVLGVGAAGGPARQHLALEQMPLLRGFTAEQIARLRPFLEKSEFAPGAVIFKEGDPGSQLFLVAQGHASANLVLDSGGIRLATFAPGAAFGELAILDGGPRSATVVADEQVHAFSLSVAAFGALQAKEPELAVLILTALGRELSDRLRQANRTIHQLEA
jgi:MFS superfamily sulfate permease-like transporter